MATPTSPADRQTAYEWAVQNQRYPEQRAQVIQLLEQGSALGFDPTCLSSGDNPLYFLANAANHSAVELLLKNYQANPNLDIGKRSSSDSSFAARLTPLRILTGTKPCDGITDDDIKKTIAVLKKYGAVRY